MDPLAEDFFLHTPINPKISHAPLANEISKVPLKVELQILRLSADSQKSVMDTLKHVHGDDFALNAIDQYQDKGCNLGNKYWMERGNLVVQGGIDYSAPQNQDQNTSAEDKFRMFALLKLESYGFHKIHCVEALDYCKSEVEAAIELLYSKYFTMDHKSKEEMEFSSEELLEQRVDEKNVLESIYESAFVEKEVNKIWNVTLSLDHLLKYSESEKKKKAKVVQKSYSNYNTPKPLQMCRNFLKGNCKFGGKCRFSHILEKPKPKEINSNDSHLFYLEIRFPDKSLYPFESPIILLKSTILDFPELFCLHLCKRLLDEANMLNCDGIASVYSIIELLKNEDELDLYLSTTKVRFISAGEVLFPNTREKVEKLTKRPSHYNKGTTGRSERSKNNKETVSKDDENLSKKFFKIQTNTKYNEFKKLRSQLPAWSQMQDIINMIDNSQVVVISGETGCGKSTQVPQFILDDWLVNYVTVQHVEIVCTQPRRISAIAVAERVADERTERIGDTVGYQIRLESKVSPQTRLTFCTTGILLRRLEGEPNLSSVTHIIVDEVHERSEESDFLLMILKDLLLIRKDLKIILMSATLNANLFSDYFGGAPTLEIPGRTFPVEQLFLEDILDSCDFVLEENSKYTRRTKKSFGETLDTELETADVLSANAMPNASIRDENLNVAQICARYQAHSKQTCKTIYISDQDKINPDLIESVLTYIVAGDHEWPKEGAILIFLPGLADITLVLDHLKDTQMFSPREGHFLLVPLHSSLSSEEQSAVFKKPKKGVRKIVLSTNIAETSVTIDDCVFVIDSGKMKEKRFDWNRNMESLDLVWVSRANAMQRKGRAGRVMPGICIHLYTGHRYRNHLLSQPVPEIHRVPLEQLLLRIKVLSNFDDRDLHNVLGGTLEPPSVDNISSAIVRLQNVGALDTDNNLTPLGHHLAALPVDVRIGKLMLFGAIFHCVDAALTMAACLSYKSPFVAPFDKRDQADAKKNHLLQVTVTT